VLLNDLWIWAIPNELGPIEAKMIEVVLALKPDVFNGILIGSIGGKSRQISGHSFSSSPWLTSVSNALTYVSP